MAPESGPVIVLGDLLADLALHIRSFPVVATDMQPLRYLDLGPGGACNTAIMAARLGLPVACLGEVGADSFGEIVRGGLQREGIDVSGVVVSPQGRTPVAAVLVDAAAEPAYLGYRGDLRLAALPDAWRGRLRGARALFADGWAEHAGVATMVLDAFRVAKDTDIPVFFDPGPGNPGLDNAWQQEAIGLATVVLANERESLALSGQTEALAAGRALLARGPQLVVVKRGKEGCMLFTPEETVHAAGYAVAAVDTTGAGDSLAAAVIYGMLHHLALPALGILANAVGAAKVQKRGTGHNVPTIEEVRGVLARFGENEVWGLLR